MRALIIVCGIALCVGCQPSTSSGGKVIYVGKGKKGIGGGPFAADAAHGAWFVQDGKIFTIDAAGKRTEVAKTPELEPVYALRVDGGQAYLLTETGRVVRIDPATGKSTTVLPTQDGERALKGSMRNNQNIAPGSLEVSDDAVFTLTRYGEKYRIRAASKEDGTERWVIDREGRIDHIVYHANSLYWVEGANFGSGQIYRADSGAGRAEAVRAGNAAVFGVYAGADLLVQDDERLYQQKGTEEITLWRGPASYVQGLDNGDVFWAVMQPLDVADSFCALVGYRASTSLGGDNIKLMMDPCPLDGFVATEGAVYWWGGTSSELHVYEY